MSNLSGKSILVTGASSGIGREISQQLLDQGASVFAMCRQIGKVPDGATPISCDLSIPDRINHAFDILDAATPQIDALVNNAGIAYLSRLTDGDPVDWARMWEVNVLGLAICSQNALKRFPNTGGRIINVSSLSGHRVPPTGGFYAPTKFAVRAITESLRNEFRLDNSPHQISSVSPGFVDTPLVDNYFLNREEELSQLRATMRMLDPTDIAQAVLHILHSPPHVEVGDITIRSSDQKV